MINRDLKISMFFFLFISDFVNPTTAKIFIIHFKNFISMVNKDTSSDVAIKKDQSSLDVQKILSQPYKYGFTTNVEVEDFPKGISENVIKMISSKKKEPQFMLDFRLRAYSYWQKNDCSYMGFYSLY